MQQIKFKTILFSFLVLASSGLGQSATRYQTGGIGTTTRVVSSQNPSQAGQSITFTATVASSRGTPSGYVQFRDGTTVFATATIRSGRAAATTASLQAGTHYIRAVYVGNSSYGASSSGPLSQVVNQATTTKTPTAASLTASANPATAGQAITFTAAVTASNGGTPSGSIQFRDGSSALATVNLSSGRASLTINSLTAGTHSITAAYGGDSLYASSVSPALSETVTSNSGTTTSLTSSLNPSTAGQAVTFKAVVSAAGGTPTGSVQFLDGSTLLSTATLNSGAASLTVSSLSAGTHSITAKYTGSSSYSSSSAALSQKVNARSVLLTWGASPSTNVAGYNVYRSGTSGGPYLLLTSSPVTGVSYEDANVASGQTYYYVCTALDGSNNESGHSNQAQAVAQ